MKSGSYRILLADDHMLFRKGLRMILERRPDLEVVGEAGDGLEVLQLLKEVIPEIVILDISMPKLRGIEAIREMKSLYPGIKSLILTMYKDEEYLRQGISSGAQGYLLKEDADTDLLSAIETIQRGGIYLSPRFSGESKEGWIGLLRNKGNHSFPESLTTREKEVLKLIAEGKTGKEIAELLFISFRTVERHRANMMEKLKVNKTADLVRYAVQNGYV